MVLLHTHPKGQFPSVFRANIDNYTLNSELYMFRHIYIYTHVDRHVSLKTRFPFHAPCPFPFDFPFRKP